MRSALLVVAASLALAAPAGASQWHPSAAWLAQAQCIHRHEGAWNANTGNGYFGGMQIAPTTWLAMNGPHVAAFAHPGDTSFPFAVQPRVQLHVAWLLWVHDGRTWRSWGATGRACS